MIIPDWNLFWTGLSAISAFLSLIAAILIYILARNELIKNNHIAELDIYFKIKADLNSEASLKVYRALKEDQLKFVKNQDGTSHFLKIDSNHVWDIFPMHDVDLCFLGHLEDLAMAYERDLISIETVKSGYSTLIFVVGSSPCIYNYILYLRNEKFNDNDIYSGFTNLYRKLYSELSDDLKKKYISPLT